MGLPHVAIWTDCCYFLYSQELASTYCPQIDPALFQAIALDYDLAIPDQVEQLRQTLDVLKLSAAEQEDLPFDPTGTTNLRNCESLGSPYTETSGSATNSDPTTWTSLEHLGSENGDINSESSAANFSKDSQRSQRFASTISAENAQTLIGMFPSITRLEAEGILEDCNDDLSRAMDVLLNLAFIEETQIAGDVSQQTEIAQGFGQSGALKSIDGFQAAENQTSNKKSRRKKNKQQKQKVVDLSARPTVAPTTNKWETGKNDIDFMATRASALQREKIASAHHADPSHNWLIAGPRADQKQLPDGAWLAGVVRFQHLGNRQMHRHTEDSTAHDALIVMLEPRQRNELRSGMKQPRKPG